MTEKLRLSFSKAKTFSRCGQEYIWKYIEKLTPKEKSFPLKLGDITHHLLHENDKGELSLEDIQDYKVVSDIALERYPDDEEDTVLSLTSQASTLCSGYLNEHAGSDIKIIPGESLLEVEMDDCTLIGIIDGWARPPDGKLFRLERKTAARIDNNYLGGLKGGLQGAIYDYITEQLFQEKLHGTIYDMLVKTKVPKFPRTFAKCDRTSIKLMQQYIKGVVKDIKAGDFYPNPDSCFRYNSTCPYRVLCTFDSPSARESFFTKRKEVHDTQDVVNAGEKQSLSDNTPQQKE